MKRIKETIGKTIEVTGLTLAMIGACGMDSADMRYPVAMLAAGAAMMWLGSRLNPLMPEDYCDAN